jgi:hypothetical protein
MVIVAIIHNSAILKWIVKNSIGVIFMDIYILDSKEEKALLELDKRYQKFIEPSIMNKGAEQLKIIGDKVIPDQISDYVKKGTSIISEADIWKKVMDMATGGFMVLQGVSAKYSIDDKKILNQMKNIDSEIDSLEKIYRMRSYDIHKILTSNDWKIYLPNAAQAGVCGATGIAGLAANIVLGTFIQFRTVQLIAMHYGYDVKNNQDEMDYAGSVLMQIMMKGQVCEGDQYGEMIAKMMAQAELNSLRQALKSKSHKQLIESGGAQLLYVQLRAITNKAAEKAMNGAGVSGIENKALKRILEELSKRMGKQNAAKAIPGLSAVLSVCIDSYQINKIMKF